MNRPLLRQKLALPPLWREALLRERLLHRLDRAIAEARHIGLFAGTGYGKTTLLAEWARRHTTVWLTLDAEDADLDVFLGYLIYAFEKALPGFTTEAHAMLGRAREREGAQAALSALLADLDEQGDRPLNLVLDDYHLAASPSLDALVARLIKYLPPSIRLVLAARKPPGIELATLQAGRRLLILAEQDLAFNQDEIRSLRAEQPDATASEQLASTGGWPAAMGLPPELLDAYLEEQLLSGVPEEQRELLQRLALVDVFDAQLCEEALGVPLTRERREALLEDRLISARGRDGYVLHPALKSLLQRRFALDVGRDERQALLRQVGDYYWRTGQASTALRFWIDAGQALWAADRLVEVAESWLAEGRLEAIASALDALGTEAERAELLVVQGELARRWGDFARAEQLFERTLALENPHDAATVAVAPIIFARARLGQAQVAAGRGNVGLARAPLAAAREALMAVPRYALDALNLEGGLALLSGDTEEARARFEAASQLARRLADPYATARALHNLGICYIRLGEFTLALGCYDAGLAMPTADGTPLIWMTPINRALVLIHLGRVAEAEEAARRALALVRQYRLTREEGYALRILGFAQLRHGAFEEAATCFDSAEQLARGMGDTLGVAYSLNFRAELAIARGEAARAVELTEDVKRAMGGDQQAAGILEFDQVRAKAFMAAGQPASAAPLIASLLERARSAGYQHILQEAEQLASQLAEAPNGAPIPARSAGETQPVLVEKKAPELRVQCFGGFHVLREDGEIGEKEWQTVRAKLLFAYFIFHAEGAPKLRLLDAVFAGEEISNDLMNMTLMRLRKALEPGLQKGQPSRYILRADGRYAFNRQTGLELDTQTFELLARAGMQAQSPEAEALLEQALSVYRGEFLPDFDPAWVVALRQRFQGLAVDVCRRLLALYDEHRPEAAIPLLERALEIDPLSDELNRELILRFLESEQQHRALAHFRLCERRYHDLLDSPPPRDLASLVLRDAES